jgi:hypothetical protein
MMSRVHRLIVALGLIASDADPQARTTHAHTPEQLTFSAENDRVERPISLPPSVASILLKDADIQARLTDEQKSDKQLPSGWVSASEVT